MLSRKRRASTGTRNPHLRFVRQYFGGEPDGVANTAYRQKVSVPICRELALILSAATLAFASRTISDLSCPNGHSIRITPGGKVVTSSTSRRERKGAGKV